MYFYCFDHGYTSNIYKSVSSWTQPGDLLFFEEKYYLNLWEDISWPEQWATNIHFDNHKIIKRFCEETTLTLLHRMVNEWFSSYNKCIPLFFGIDIITTIKHKKQIIPSKNSKRPQKLYIFPSIFSLTGYYNQLEERDKEKSLIIYGQSTQVQRAKAYRAIQNNEILTIFATHSQIFRDRSNLKEMAVMDEYSPFYQTYQEPRYTLSLVTEKMRELYST